MSRVSPLKPVPTLSVPKLQAEKQCQSCLDYPGVYLEIYKITLIESLSKYKVQLTKIHTMSLMS